MTRISPRRVLQRLHGIARPPLTITPPPDGVLTDWNCAITARDGTILRANVFRLAPNSAGDLVHPDGRFPVIMCAHPYGKDVLPKKVPWGYLPPLQYRVFRQPEPITFSAWTGWEGPDPAYWVRLGFAVVVGDLRGAGAGVVVVALCHGRSGAQLKVGGLSKSRAAHCRCLARGQPAAHAAAVCNAPNPLLCEPAKTQACHPA